MPAHNETGCRNSGTPRTAALKFPAGARGQEQRQQVISSQNNLASLCTLNQKRGSLKPETASLIDDLSPFPFPKRGSAGGWGVTAPLSSQPPL